MKGHVDRGLDQTLRLKEWLSQAAERSGTVGPSGRSITLARALRRSTRIWTGILSCMAATLVIAPIRCSARRRASSAAMAISRAAVPGAPYLSPVTGVLSPGRLSSPDNAS